MVKVNLTNQDIEFIAQRARRLVCGQPDSDARSQPLPPMDLPALVVMLTSDLLAEREDRLRLLCLVDLLARITDGIDEIEAELKEALGDDVGGGDTEGVTTTGSAVNPLQQRKSAALYYNDGEDGFSAAPKGEIRAEDIPKNPSPFDPRPGALDMSIQFTYSKPDAPDPDRRHTALFTCRGKDHDLDAVQWRRVAEAAGRIAERLEADDRAVASEPVQVRSKGGPGGGVHLGRRHHPLRPALSRGQHVRSHEHKAAQHREGPYQGPANLRRPVPAAHGAITRIEACRCGASRQINIKGAHREVGPWTKESSAWRDDR